MKLLLPRHFLLIVSLAGPVFGADLYQAIFGPAIDPQIKYKKVPVVTIKKLSDEEQKEVATAAGGELLVLPEAKGVKVPQITYPFEMRRNGQTAVVTCIVRVSAKGKILTIYRLGDDSDLFFTECARSLTEATFPKADGERYYRFVARAGLVPGGLVPAQAPRKKA